jgi:hypothetical protein
MEYNKNIIESILNDNYNGKVCEYKLSKLPALPEHNREGFITKLINDNYEKTIKNCKRDYEVNSVDTRQLLSDFKKNVYEIVQIERKNKDKLIELTKKMICDKYDVTENEVTFDLGITEDFSDYKEKEVVSEDIELEDYNDLNNVHNKVNKKLLLNSLCIGAANYENKLYRGFEDELSDIDPRLVNKYDRMVSGSNYLKYVNGFDGNVDKVIGGYSNVNYDGEKPCVIVRALCLPILIYEVIKVLNQLICSNADSDDNEKLIEYVDSKVISNSVDEYGDFVGSGLYERIVGCVPEEYSNKKIKHHLIYEIASMGEEFNDNLREVLIGTKKGKKIIGDMCESICEDLKQEGYLDSIKEFNEFMEKQDLDDLNLVDYF